MILETGTCDQIKCKKHSSKTKQKWHDDACITDNPFHANTTLHRKTHIHIPNKALPYADSSNYRTPSNRNGQGNIFQQKKH